MGEEDSLATAAASAEAILSADEKAALEKETAEILSEEEQLQQLIQNEINSFLRKVPMFRDVNNEDFISQLGLVMQEKSIGASTMIVAQGEVGHEMFFVVDGTALVYVNREQLQQGRPVAKVGPANFFGEAALLTSEPRNAFIRSQTEMELYVLSKEDLALVLRNFPAVAQSFNQVVAKRQQVREAHSAQDVAAQDLTPRLLPPPPHPKPQQPAAAAAGDKAAADDKEEEMQRAIQSAIQVKTHIRLESQNMLACFSISVDSSQIAGVFRNSFGKSRCSGMSTTKISSHSSDWSCKKSPSAPAP